jgi:hypothetical protein
MKTSLLKLSILSILLFIISLKASAQITVDNVRNVYYNARASVDAYKLKNSGPSYTDESDKNRLYADLAFLIGFNLILGNYGPGHTAPKLMRNHQGENPYLEQASINKDEDLPLRDRFPMKAPVLTGYPFITLGIDYKIKSSNAVSQGFSTIYTLQYLQFPLMFNYMKPINAISGVHGGIGPYFAYALSGKAKTSSTNTSLKLGSSENDDYKPGDFGIGINAGYAINNKWDISLNYDLGLKNISTTPGDPDSHISGFALYITRTF